MIWVVAFHCDCVLVTTSLVIGRVVKDVDRREVIQVFALNFLSTRSSIEKLCTARRFAT